MDMENERYIEPQWKTRFPNLIVAQTTRLGGASSPPYASFNLGLYTADTPSALTRNRNILLQDLQITSDQLVWSKQIHGTSIHFAKTGGGTDGCDAILVDKPGLVACVSVADCCPVLVYDSQQHVCAAIHAGWKGTVGKLVAKTLLEMKSLYQTRAEDCWVYIGTCISKESFEADADVADLFENNQKTWDPEKKKYLIDLKQTNKEQVQLFGIPDEQIEVSSYCTVLDNHLFYSHRAEKGTTGRQIAIIGMRNHI